MTTDASTAAPAKTEARKTKAPKGYHHCECLHGTKHKCTGQTQGAFARGHDARMASRLAQAVADGTMPLDQARKDLTEAGGGSLLLGKMERSAIQRQDRKAGRAPKAKKDKEAPASEAEAPAVVLNTKVRVAHGKREFDALTVRTMGNPGDDIVARHRFQGKNCDHTEWVVADQGK